MNKHRQVRCRVSDVGCQTRPTPRFSHSTSHIPHPTSSRGSILIAIIIALVMVQIVVIGIVTLAPRNQNLFKLRLEAAQAQYAAEAGMHMALREMYDSADEDTDGGVGSISSKTINGCTVVVTMSVSGSTTTLTATATATTATRKVVVTLSS